MHWLFWSLFGKVSVIVFSELGRPKVSFVKFAKTAPMARQLIKSERKTFLTELNPDGSTSEKGKWKPLYPVDYDHPENVKNAKIPRNTKIDTVGSSV